jgi:hypothetical protein
VDEPSTGTWSTLVLGTQQTGFTERLEAARAKVDARHKALAEAKERGAQPLDFSGPTRPTN